MAGWQRSVRAPSWADTWADHVRELYLRSPDMEVGEFEALLEVALLGERPKHPGLPAYLPLGMGTGGELR